MFCLTQDRVVIAFWSVCTVLEGRADLICFTSVIHCDPAQAQKRCPSEGVPGAKKIHTRPPHESDDEQ